MHNALRCSAGIFLGALLPAFAATSASGQAQEDVLVEPGQTFTARVLEVTDGDTLRYPPLGWWRGNHSPSRRRRAGVFAVLRHGRYKSRTAVRGRKGRAGYRRRDWPLRPRCGPLRGEVTEEPTLPLARFTGALNKPLLPYPLLPYANHNRASEGAPKAVAGDHC